MMHKKDWQLVILSASLAAQGQLAHAQLRPPVPIVDGEPAPNLEGIVTDPRAALVLGKALFWDQQAGSDGMACASCHFSAGADGRIKGQLSPGLNDVSFAGGDTEFGSLHSDTGEVLPGMMPSGNPAGPDYTLVSADFPLHQLSDYRDRNSDLISTTNDVVSSSGTYSARFFRAGLLGTDDRCSAAEGSVFRAGKHPARQVEPRNTPTSINAALFHANFWDGRANNLFNGVGVFGLRDIEADPTKRLIVLDGKGRPELGYLEVRNASLASQALGPPVNGLEMACTGRSFPDVARKLLTTIPLRKQRVSTGDSVLGPYANRFGPGLKPTHLYAALIMRAFASKYWALPGLYRIADEDHDGVAELHRDLRGYTQMEINFSMFWGLSIMLYERTLISDQSRFDSWFASCRPAVGQNPDPLGVPVGNPEVSCLPTPENPIQSTDPVDHGFTAQETLGFALFNNAGAGLRNPGNPACASCHGPIANPRAATGIVASTFSEAAFQEGQSFVPVERSLIVELGDGLPPISLPTTDQRAGAMHDRGFFNIGVTPAHVDLGNGGLDAYGLPISLSRMFLAEQAGQTVLDPVLAITPAAPRGVSLINRCTGVLEPGGTPAFFGCPSADPPVLDDKLERELVDGSFKTPSLRNVGLTAPYFHSGNYADLRSVMEFYARGGSRRSKSLEDATLTGDTSGTGPLGKDSLSPRGAHFGTNVDFFIRDLKSTDEQIDAIVAFMLTLTDPRVQCDQAPFDHPELLIRHGHTGDDRRPRDGKADDDTVVLPAVGARGYATRSGYCVPNTGDLFAPGMQARAGGARVRW